MICNKPHRYNQEFELLPDDQSKFNGRHKCVGCAYDRGYELGLARAQELSIDYSTLPDSQAGAGRHKSVQTAFAEGYRQGILASYNVS